jgi:hypothetical protein
MSEPKVIALGIICVILAVGLVGALAYSESIINTKSSQDQTPSWTEGNFGFNLNATNDTSYTIPTGGFRSLTIMISASHSAFESPIANVFQVFVGFMVNETLVGYQVYDVLSVPVFPMATILPGSAPWTSESRMTTAGSFEQTFEIQSSAIMVWIWDNSTVNISGSVYYYLTA